MGTDKRERKKANRAAKIADQEAAEAKARRIKAIRNVVLFGVGIVIVAVLLSLTACGADTDTDDAAGNRPDTTDTTATTTGASSPADPDGDETGDPAYGDGECPPVEGVDEPVIDFTIAPQLCIDPARSYMATFATTLGEFTVELDTERTPLTTNNFVVLARFGYFDGTEFKPLIAAAGLMNAAGRAGRAGRETEGWVVIADQKGAPNARVAVRELETPQDIRSTLNTEVALAELASYEVLVHSTGVLALENVPATVDGFMSYCWYLASVHDALTAAQRTDGVIAGIRRTLAWQQLPEAIRLRWEALSLRVTQSYEVTDEARRRRWARSGARLSANLVLEEVARQGASAVAALNTQELESPVTLLHALLADGRLAAILSLTNPRDYRFKIRRTGPVEEANIDLLALVLDWVRGAPLAELSDNHLHQVLDTDDEAFRFEQLSTFLTRVCEHHLPFTLGTILDWVGDELGFTINPNLPAHVHYGVPNMQAIELLKGGVRSRRLAVATSSAAVAAGVETDLLRPWVSELGIVAWRTDLEAGPAEIADLLQFVHDPSAAISAALLDGESKVILVDPTDASSSDEADLAISWAIGDDELPRPLLVVSTTGETVARVRAPEYRHLQVLVDAGFELLATATSWDDAGHVLAVTVCAQID